MCVGCRFFNFHQNNLTLGFIKYFIFYLNDKNEVQFIHH